MVRIVQMEAVWTYRSLVSTLSLNLWLFIVCIQEKAHGVVGFSAQPFLVSSHPRNSHRPDCYNDVCGRCMLQVASNLQEETTEDLIRGIPYDFIIVKSYVAPQEFDWTTIDLEASHIARLDLGVHNVSLPVALMISDPIDFPSLSKARKACRKGSIVIERCNIPNSDGRSRFIGRVGDRVLSGDTVSLQQRMAPEAQVYETTLRSHGKPPFELPVVYEDDHMAIVNKPAGIVVHRQGQSTSGLLTIRGVLPFVLKPPASGTMNIMRRPASVHRLDKPTSGVLVVAKTKSALVDLSLQFRSRAIQKTYLAIVQGIPDEKFEDSVPSSIAAERWNVDTSGYDDKIRWNVIDAMLDDKSAVTVWRAVKYVKSLQAGYLTLVELKPKTGRYHQLRRHMAWICETPIVGDTKYDGGTDVSRKFRDNGLFLCSTKVILEHPFYSSADCPHNYDELMQQNPLLSLSNDGSKLMLSASVPIPAKFDSLLNREEKRYDRLSDAPNGDES